MGLLHEDEHTGDVIKEDKKEKCPTFIYISGLQCFLIHWNFTLMLRIL